MLTAALFTTARNRISLGVHLLVKGIIKMWYLIHTGTVLVIKKNEVRKFAGKWMDLENIQSEVTPAQKDKHCKPSLLCEL